MKIQSIDLSFLDKVVVTLTAFLTAMKITGLSANELSWLDVFSPMLILVSLALLVGLIRNAIKKQ